MRLRVNSTVKCIRGYWTDRGLFECLLLKILLNPNSPHSLSADTELAADTDRKSDGLPYIDCLVAHHHADSDGNRWKAIIN